jgi:hypothetical protein
MKRSCICVLWLSSKFVMNNCCLVNMRIVSICDEMVRALLIESHELVESILASCRPTCVLWLHQRTRDFCFKLKVNVYCWQYLWRNGQCFAQWISMNRFESILSWKDLHICSVTFIKIVRAQVHRLEAQLSANEADPSIDGLYSVELNG